MSATNSQSTAASRSRAALPSDYRRVLEASNLPIEQAVAIADMVELALSDTAARNAALEEAAKLVESSPSAYRKEIAERIRALKGSAAPKSLPQIPCDPVPEYARPEKSDSTNSLHGEAGLAKGIQIVQPAAAAPDAELVSKGAPWNWATDQNVADICGQDRFRLESRADANHNFAIGRPFAESLISLLNECERRLSRQPAEARVSEEAVQVADRGEVTRKNFEILARELLRLARKGG